MDDNARPHQTLAVEELLESEDITRMDWPAYSPDLNPIEYVWDAFRIRIAARLHHPENTQQLKQRLIEEWALLPQEMLHQMVLSMRRRCEATIACLRGVDFSSSSLSPSGPQTPSTVRSKANSIISLSLNASPSQAIYLLIIVAVKCTGSCFKSLPLRARGLRDLFIKERFFNICSPDALLQINKVTRSLLMLYVPTCSFFYPWRVSSGNTFAAPSSAARHFPCYLLNIMKCISFKNPGSHPLLAGNSFLSWEVEADGSRAVSLRAFSLD
ncbi:transposable element Tcb2 transposase [Trichonephila clavipes]|nr:transposable element Tcb2 transposase [Trichonephila clavipes]